MQPFFNVQPDKLMCPGKLVGRAEGRDNWTLIFTATKQISSTVFEGDLRWLAEPREQDFGPGVKFQMLSLRGQRRTLVGKDQEPQNPDELQRKGKGRGRDKSGVPPVKHKDRSDHVEKHHEPSSHVPQKSFTDKPMTMGPFAEGELLG